MCQAFTPASDKVGEKLCNYEDETKARKHEIAHRLDSAAIRKDEW
jgi:hypothetical protein